MLDWCFARERAGVEALRGGITPMHEDGRRLRTKTESVYTPCGITSRGHFIGGRVSVRAELPTGDVAHEIFVTSATVAFLLEKFHAILLGVK